MSATRPTPSKASVLLSPEANARLNAIRISNRAMFDRILEWLEQQQQKLLSSSSMVSAKLSDGDKSFQLLAGTFLIYRILQGTTHHAVTDTIKALREIYQDSDVVASPSLPILIRTFLLHVVNNKTNKEALHQLTASLPLECHPLTEVLTGKLALMLEECNRIELTYDDFCILYTPVASLAARQLQNVPIAPEVFASVNQEQHIRLLAWKLASRLHRHQDHGASLWRPKRLLASAAVLGCFTLLPEYPVNTNAEDYSSPILTLQHLHRTANARIRATGMHLDTLPKHADRIIIEQLRGEIVKLTKELRVVLNDLRLKNMLTTDYPGPGEGHPPPSAAAVTCPSRVSFLRELVGPASADELLWYLPEIVNHLHEDDPTACVDLCYLVQDHVTRYLESTPSTIPKQTNGGTANQKPLATKQCPTGEVTLTETPAGAKPVNPPAGPPAGATDAPPAPPAGTMDDETTQTTIINDVADLLEETSAPSIEMIKEALESIENIRAQQRSSKISFPPESSSSTFLLEAMELNEWAVSLSFIEVVKPSAALVDVLEHASGAGGQAVLEWQDVILHRTLNKSLLRLSQEHLRDAKATRKAPVTVQTGAVSAGVVQVHGGELTPDKQLCKIVVAFYYHCLEAVLYCETKRTKKLHKKEKRSKYHSYEKNDFTAIRQSCSNLILSPSFHAALLACCTLCVTHAVGCTPALRPCAYLRRCDILTILHVTSTTPYEFLKVSETVRRALAPSSPACGKIESPLVFALPTVLQRLIQQTEVHILDSLVWARNNDNTRTTTVTVDGDSFWCLPDIIDEWMEKTATLKHLRLWPPRELDLPEEENPSNLTEPTAVSNHDTVVYPGPDHDSYAEIQSAWYVIRKMMNVTESRIHAICQKLGMDEDSVIPGQIYLAFRYLLRHRLELLYDRHVDQWILCCVYGVCRAVDYRRRKLEPQADAGMTPIAFADIIAAYVELRQGELGSVVCQRIVRRIQVQSMHPRDTSAVTSSSSHHIDGVGDIIALYNQVFVPALKEHLLASPSLQKLKADLEKQQALEQKLPEGDAVVMDSERGSAITTAEKRAGHGRLHVTVDHNRHQKEFLNDAGSGPVVSIRLGGGILSAVANEYTGRKRKLTVMK